MFYLGSSTCYTYLQVVVSQIPHFTTWMNSCPTAENFIIYNAHSVCVDRIVSGMGALGAKRAGNLHTQYTYMVLLFILVLIVDENANLP